MFSYFQPPMAAMTCCSVIWTRAKAVGPGLFVNGGRHGLFQSRVTGPAAEQGPQIGALAVAQAGLEQAGAGHPRPVAAGAERVAHGLDPADAAQQPGAGVVVGRTVAPVLVHRVQVGPLGQQQFAGLRRGKTAALRPRADGHDLDEPHIHRAALSQLCHREHPALAARQQHKVDFGAEPRRQTGVQPGQYVPELVKARDGLERFRIGGVQADVHAVHARGFQRRDQLRQPDTVGGQGHFLHAGQPLEGRDKIRDPLAHQRLPARDLEAGNAQMHRRPRNAQEFFVGQDLLVGRELHPVGHTIFAAQVAAVGDGQAQVIDVPPEMVFQCSCSSK